MIKQAISWVASIIDAVCFKPESKVLAVNVDRLTREAFSGTILFHVRGLAIPVGFKLVLSMKNPTKLEIFCPPIIRGQVDAATTEIHDIIVDAYRSTLSDMDRTN